MATPITTPATATADPAGTVVQLTPYPAAFILEHAKRKHFAAGLVIGSRTSDEIIVTDFIPISHNDTEMVNSKAYRTEILRRRNVKRRFTNHEVIGWYSAGQASEDITPDAYALWCDAPAVLFLGRNALHLHCELPDLKSTKLEVAWTACVVFEDKADRTLKRIDHKVVVAPANSVSSDVMLTCVASQVLYNGGRPYERSKLLNLDEVAYIAGVDNRSSTDAVNTVYDKMQKTVAEVNGLLAAAREGNEKVKGVEIAEEVGRLRTIREDALQRQRHQMARLDFNTQQIKDALLLKCTATVLLKGISQVSMLSTTYAEEGANRPASPAAAKQ